MQVYVWVEAQSLGIALSVRRCPGVHAPGLGFDGPKPMPQETLTELYSSVMNKRYSRQSSSQTSSSIRFSAGIGSARVSLSRFVGGAEQL